MAMTDELIWREDVAKEIEYLGEGARNLANFYHRAREQGAPAELLTELSLVWSDLTNARQKLDAILPCFSPEPRSGL